MKFIILFSLIAAFSLSASALNHRACIADLHGSALTFFQELSLPVDDKNTAIAKKVFKGLQLRHRRGLILRGVAWKDSPSILSHSKRVEWTISMLARLLPELNSQEARLIGRYHDIPEFELEDWTPPDIEWGVITEEEKHKQELASITRLAGEIGGAPGKKLLGHWSEYFEGETTRVKFIKHIDKITVIGDFVEARAIGYVHLDPLEPTEKILRYGQNPVLIDLAKFLISRVDYDNTSPGWYERQVEIFVRDRI